MINFLLKINIILFAIFIFLCDFKQDVKIFVSKTCDLLLSLILLKVAMTHSFSNSPGTSSLFEYLELLHHEEIVHDKPLDNWARWLKIRRKQFEKLSKATKREPECLLMNIISNLQLNADKEAIKHAADYQGKDNFGGHPRFWMTVKPLRDERKPKLENLIYPGNVKFEDNPSSLIEKGYFGLSDLILKESVKGCNRDYNARKDKSFKYYLEKRKNELADTINIVEPFRPDISKLFIQGVGCKDISYKDRKTTIIPEITIDHCSNKNFEHSYPDKTILKIGEITLSQETVQNNQALEEYQWSLTFVNKYVGEKYSEQVNFYNMGSTAIHYYWQMIGKYTKEEFPIKHSRHRMSKFFFDNSPGILFPGQQFDIKFMFRCNTPGIFRNIWLFNTKPQVRSTPIYFILEGIATEKVHDSNTITWNKIEGYMQKCANESFVKKLLMDVETHAKLPKGRLNYYQMYSMKELFQVVNPNLFYKQNEVEELKDLHKKFSKFKWSLSVEDVNDEVLGEDNCEVNDDYLRKLDEIVEELSSPPEEMGFTNMKFKTVYLLLGLFTSQIEKTGEKLQRLYNLKPLPKIGSFNPTKLNLSDSMEDLMQAETVQFDSSNEDLLEDEIKKSKLNVKAAGKPSTRPSKLITTNKNKETKGSPLTAKEQWQWSAKKDIIKPYIKLISSVPDKEQKKPVWKPEKKRSFYQNLLLAHTKDYLIKTIEKICTVVDCINAASETDIIPVERITHLDEDFKFNTTLVEPNLN